MSAVQKLEAPAPFEGVAHAQSAQAMALVDLIQKAASNPEIDLDRMERLFEMRERVLAQEAKRSFFTAMKAAQAEMPIVLKNAANDHTRSRYATYDQVSKAMQPVISRHGFSLTFSTEPSQIPGHLRVICECAHEDGHSKIEAADLPYDAAGAQGKANKTGVQAYGSTVSYARRYLKCMIFDVAVGEDDTDGNSAATLDALQIRQIKEALATPGQSADGFLAFMAVEAIEDIPASKFKFALDAIKAKGRAQ